MFIKKITVFGVAFASRQVYDSFRPLTKRMKISWYFKLSLKTTMKVYDINRFQTDYHVHRSGKNKIHKKRFQKPNFWCVSFSYIFSLIFLRSRWWPPESLTVSPRSEKRKGFFFSLIFQGYPFPFYRHQSKLSSSKKFTCKGTLRQMFIGAYRLDIQSVMLVFSTQLCELLPL